uniref:CSD domain-containing protein n=1 Tax=viral metagenome TaxID=1070528 RepID=A0A6C0KI49_9ZZZZ
MATTDNKTSKYGESTYSGCVKWFQKTGGWGFIKITSGSFDGEDIFVHWNSLTVDKEQYKYLIAGEYVTFNILFTPDNEKHQYQAENVRGVNGGTLMCETRNEQRTNTSPTQGTRKPQRGTGRKFNNRPDNAVNINSVMSQSDGNTEWYLVKRNLDERPSTRRNFNRY